MDGASVKRTPLSRRLLALGTSDNLLTVLLFLAIVLTCALMPMQGDTWWQLRAGKDMWESRSVLFVDTYSYTVAGSPWPNHEWLAEVIFFAAYRAGGLGALTLLATGLITAGWVFSWRLTRAAVDVKFAWTIAALVPAAVWWEPRPHAFSLCFIPLTISLFVKGRLWWIPLVFVAWANSHGGVLLGFVLLITAVSAEVALDRTRLRSRLVLVGLCMLAMTLTPMGIHFWTEIPLSLARISQYTFDEWRRPGLLELPMLPFWAIALVLVVTLVRKASTLRRLAPEQLAICAVAFVLLLGAVTSIRHVGPFLLLALPALGVLAGHRAPSRRTTGDKPAFNLGFIALAVTTVGCVIVLAYSNQWPRLRWQPVPAAALGAVDACPGNLYHRYDEGGYLLWFLPQRKVFLDGRQDPYPVEMVLEHIRMEMGDGEFKDVFSRYEIQCAFLPSHSPTVARLSAAGWSEAYRDRRWIVFRRPVTGIGPPG